MAKSKNQQKVKKSNESPKPKIIRKIGETKFNSVENAFQEQLKRSEKLSNEINTLETIVRDRAISTTGKDGKTVVTKISQAQLIGFRKKLSDLKFELKISNKKLKGLSLRYKRASRHNIQANQQRVKSFNEKTKLSHEAIRKEKEITEAVKGAIKKIGSSQSTELKALAKNNGMKFNTQVYRFFRLSLKGTRALAMLNSSSPIRTKIFREIRAQFGWQIKK